MIFKVSGSWNLNWPWKAIDCKPAIVLPMFLERRRVLRWSQPQHQHQIRVHFPPEPLMKCPHSPPKKPGALFCSAKLALRAAAFASWEFRFWLCRLANFLLEVFDDCVVEMMRISQSLIGAMNGLYYDRCGRTRDREGLEQTGTWLGVCCAIVATCRWVEMWCVLVQMGGVIHGRWLGK